MNPQSIPYIINQISAAIEGHAFCHAA